MEPTNIPFLKNFGSLFFSYALKRMKNSKVFRDLKEKWVKDNYASRTVLMFEAAVADAKAIFPIPEEVINKLIEDKINRDEIFRWILESTPPEMYNHENLNLVPYMEKYPEYQDFFSPFFEMINLQLIENKAIHWEPEFLQILTRIKFLEEGIKEGFEEIKSQQQQNMQLTE
jgi:hypothetical protein